MSNKSVKRTAILIHAGIIFFIISFLLSLNAVYPNSTIQIIVFVALYYLYRRIYTYYLKYEFAKAEGARNVAFNDSFDIEPYAESIKPENTENTFFDKKRNEIEEFLKYCRKTGKKGNAVFVSLKWWAILPYAGGIIIMLTAFFASENVAHEIHEIRDYYAIQGLYKDKDYDTIIEKGSRDIETGSASVSKKYNVAMAHYQKQEYEEALKLFIEVIRENPGYIDAYYNIGQIYKKAGKLDEAKKAFMNVINLDKKAADAYYNLGVIEALQNNKQNALKHLEKAIEYFKKDNPWREKAVQLKNKIEKQK